MINRSATSSSKGKSSVCVVSGCNCMPGHPLFSSVVTNSFTNNANRIGLRLHHCLNPTGQKNISLKLFGFNTYFDAVVNTTYS